MLVRVNEVEFKTGILRRKYFFSRVRRVVKQRLAFATSRNSRPEYRITMVARQLRVCENRADSLSLSLSLQLRRPDKVK